jgi:hypothetical protein
MEGHKFATAAYDLLKEESYFGGQVMILCRDFHRKFTFTSWSRGRPLGDHLPVQCIKCFVLSTFEWRPSHYFGYILRCRECGAVTELEAEDNVFFPPDVIWKGEDGWAIHIYREMSTDSIACLPDYPSFIGYLDVRRALEKNETLPDVRTVNDEETTSM